LTERDKQRRSLPEMILLGNRGRLHRVRELDDPVALGVHPAAAQQQHPRDLWGTRYRLAYWMAKAEEYAEALHLWEQLVVQALDDYGRLHVWSLDARAQHADCVGLRATPAEPPRC